AQEAGLPNDAAIRCELLLLLAETLGLSGEPRRASEDVAEQAFHIAETMDDGVRATRACELAMDSLIRQVESAAWDQPAYRVWAERTERHATVGTARQIQAEVVRARVAIAEGNTDGARSLLNHALDSARRLGDLEALLE